MPEQPGTATPNPSPYIHRFAHRHLLSIADLSAQDIGLLLDRAEAYAGLTRQGVRPKPVLAGRTVINLFFENSTRTQGSFEIAAKRLGADVVTMNVATSSVKKGETLADTAMTLNAMKPDAIVVRHGSSGAVALLSRKVDCSAVNAGDGTHQHPTQALLDALTIRRHKGRFEGLVVAICGDIAHSRVARSTTQALHKLGARVRLVGPRTLMPPDTRSWGAEGAFHDMAEGLADADVVMMLRLQLERMDGGFVPSRREFFHFYGLTQARLRQARPDAIVMHPGPMNRGIEIESAIADGERSVITEQVEMGVAVREAVLDLLLHGGEVTL
jgi:aspartate carbamoyltransferase catalytic subunit